MATLIREVNTIPGLVSQAWIDRDQAVMSPSLTRSYPFVMAQGRGSEVWDVDGKRYIDLNATIAVTSTGHSHPAVVEAIRRQAGRFIQYAMTDFYTPQTIELAEQLNGLRPMHEETQVFFTNSGTETVEAAIKLARYHTGRPNFIGFLGAFHGRSLGSLAFTASKVAQRKGFGPTLPGVTHVPYCYPYRPILALRAGQDYGDAIVDYIENVVFQHLMAPTEVAAILLEPIQGEGGYVVPTSRFLPRLRRLCDKYGILLIADEVQSGMGRTGKWWAIEHWAVEPDILLSAKGIASGMPLGAMIARRSVMTWRPGSHGNTFGGNPIACAAALATIDVIEREGLLAHAAEMGAYILAALAEMQARHPSIGDVRGKGLMIGIEFVSDQETKEPAHDLSEDITQRAFQQGLLLLPCGQSTIRLSPALNIPRQLVDEALEIFEEAITEAEEATN
ncbi:MAG TPA: acetyl ornithine aminotransferase family protein [Anaerolineae bacterium]|nr:acetyl ornithine aminotransferase family protein [Anaerolineae bacterium]